MDTINLIVAILLLAAFIIFVYLNTNRLLKRIKEYPNDSSSHKLYPLINKASSEKLFLFVIKSWFYRGFILSCVTLFLQIAIKYFIVNKPIELQEEFIIFLFILMFLSLWSIYRSIILWKQANKYQKV